MMLRLLLLLPVFVLLVLFALSNQEPIHLVLWPTDVSVEVPLSLAMLGAMAVAFILGALVVQISVFAARRRARRAERMARRLEEQVRELKSRLSPPPPAGSLLPGP
jgi:putative membrane protein